MFLLLTDGWQHKARELDMITHDLDMICIISRNDVTGADSENSLYAFDQSEK